MEELIVSSKLGKKIENWLLFTVYFGDGLLTQEGCQLIIVVKTRS